MYTSWFRRSVEAAIKSTASTDEIVPGQSVIAHLKAGRVSLYHKRAQRRLQIDSDLNEAAKMLLAADERREGFENFAFVALALPQGWALNS